MKQTIAHAEREGRGRFWIQTDAGEAELVYELNGEGAMIIDHVYVPREARGQGHGRRLVAHARHNARERRRRVVLTCAFAKFASGQAGIQADAA